MEVLENYLIKILLSKKLYRDYREYINTNNFSTEYKYLISTIDLYFKDNAEDLNINKLSALVFSNYNNIKQEIKDNINNIINNISSLEDINNNIYNIIINNILKKHYAEEIINKALEIEDNPKADISTIEELLNQYKDKIKILDNTSTNLVTNDIEELFEKENNEEGFKWFCEALDMALGKVKGGDLGLVVAPPDTAKTVFILCVATSIVKQGGRVLHVNNEERGTKVKLRFVENYLNKDKVYLLNNKDEVKEVLERVKDKYFLYDITSITASEIGKLIDLHKPHVVLIDQATKIKVKDKDRYDLTLTDIFKQLRELAKEKNVHLIGVSQSDSSAYVKKFLDMSAISNSRIGVQGEVDYIVGINAEFEDISKDDIRYISTPKNKLTGSNSAKIILKINKETSSLQEI